jgi:hypothetical protein
VSSYRHCLALTFGFCAQSTVANEEFHWCMKSSGSKVRLRKCSSARSKMDFRSDGTIRKSGKCLTRSGTPFSNKRIKGIRLKSCNGSKSQKFRISGNKKKFRIQQGSFCLSSQHHPSNYESVGLPPCSFTKRDRTTYWKCT